MASPSEIQLASLNDASPSDPVPVEARIPALARFVGKYTGMSDDGVKIDKEGQEIFDYGHAAKKAQVMNMARAVKDETGKLVKVEPGVDDPTARLFPVFSTNVDELEGFGLGVVLYFKTLIVMGCCMVICFIINAWTIKYFASDKYSGGEQQKAVISAMFPDDLVGSAFCPTARQHTVLLSSGSNATLHDCPFDPRQGWLDLGSSLFLLCVILILGKVQGEQAEAIDEAVQTSQDYSIEVEDPGDDAKDNDPLEWVKFFNQFGDVHAISIAKKNGALLKLLGQRRALLRHVDMEGWAVHSDPDYVQPVLREYLISGKPYPARAEFGEAPQFPELSMGEKFGLKKSVKTQLYQLGKLNAKVLDEIDALRQQIADKGHVDNARVYVTFNLETEQRHCISALSTGSVLAFLDLPKPDIIKRIFGEEEAPVVDHFHGNVLKVTLAPEPTDINWENLDVEPIQVAAESFVFTFIGCGIVAVMAFIIKSLSSAEPTLAGFFISVCNGALPTIMKVLNNFERHPTSTSSQSSLLFKLVAARWTVSALVVYAITPWTMTIDGDKIKGVMAILIADAITTPLIRLANIGPNINKYVLGPMARTQDQLDNLLQGAPWFLAERFSDMTKTVYICLFYSAILPTGYIVAAVALFINYWVDKYCLLRNWQIPPKLDAAIAATTRSRLAMVIVIHCIITLHYYAGWPFDNIMCTDSSGSLIHDPVRCDATSADAGTVIKRVTSNVWETGNFIVFNRRGYMTDDQWDVTRAYMVFVIIAFVVVSIVYFAHSIFGFLYTLFVGVFLDTTDPALVPLSKDEDNGQYYKTPEELVNTPTIEVNGQQRHLIESRHVEIEAYIAQIDQPGLNVPQLAVYHPDMVQKKASDQWSTVSPPVRTGKSWFPAEMLSWNENEQFGVFFYDNNLYMDPIFDHIPEDERQKMFSSFHIVPPHTVEAATMESSTKNPAL